MTLVCDNCGEPYDVTPPPIKPQQIGDPLWVGIGGTNVIFDCTTGEFHGRCPHCDALDTRALETR